MRSVSEGKQQYFVFLVIYCLQSKVITRDLFSVYTGLISLKLMEALAKRSVHFICSAFEG